MPERLEKRAPLSSYSSIDMVQPLTLERDKPMSTSGLRFPSSCALAQPVQLSETYIRLPNFRCWPQRSANRQLLLVHKPEHKWLQEMDRRYSARFGVAERNAFDSPGCLNSGVV